ncbi:hypothetical protein JYU14_01925 [Simkania negevensis]|uniref:Uncharacterized protein n=1 Tax=Simkania negevensis TaxID=83561 RepID=A0ABS3AR48_9BACT|nr:hypothetical protein [Simkania negevensis]
MTRMSQAYVVREHKNEVVEVVSPSGTTDFFDPQADLHLSKELLEQFNQITSSDGIPLYKLWHYKGFYLEPALQERIFWDVFVHIVKHRKVLSYLRGKQVTFERFPYYTVSGVFRFYTFLRRHHSLLKRALYNLFPVLSSKPDLSSKILFKDDGEDGPRFGKMKASLSSFTEYVPASLLKANKRSLLSIRKCQFTYGRSCLFYPNVPKISYSPWEFLQPFLSEEEFHLLIAGIHRRCWDKICEIRSCERRFVHNRPKTILSYDQMEDAIGLIAAGRILSIPTYSFQHGVLTKFHSGWMGFGIPPEYCNLVPDAIVVWGEYWKEKLLNYSNKYRADNVIVGAHLNREIRYEFDPLSPMEAAITVLVPYEFLADNQAISKYLNLFLDYGWKVIVKLRPAGDGDVSNDILAYDEGLREQLVFQYELTDEDLRNIHVVVATQTTFAYEMLPHQKAIWYLDTPFTMLEDLVPDGFAYHVNMEIALKMKDPSFLSPYLKPCYTFDMYKHVFSDKNQKTALQELLL